MQRVAQIPERDAAPEVAALYEDIRRVTGTPLVNLIYRHLATMQGALPWVWSLIRPLVLDGTIEAAADRVGAAAHLPVLAAFSAAELQHAGIGDAEETLVRRVLWAYNRGNRLNMVSLSAVWLLLDEGATNVPRSAPLVAQRADTVEEASLPSIPPIRTPDSLDSETTARLSEIAALHSGGGVLPSLYLHLANWPGFLALAYERLIPPLRDGAVRRGGDEVARRVAREARGIAARMTTDLPAPAGHISALHAVLDTFAHSLIPEMIPVGGSLARALPEPAEAPTP